MFMDDKLSNAMDKIQEATERVVKENMRLEEELKEAKAKLKDMEDNKPEGEYKFTMEVSIREGNIKANIEGDYKAFRLGLKAMVEKHPDMKLDLMNIINK